jgi:hypothetical protein
MRLFKFALIAILSGVLFHSCDRCHNLDCPTNYHGQFRIVSAIDGKDLVFGPNKIYDKDQIKFYSIKGADTTYFGFYTFKSPNGYDSILNVLFFPKNEIAYMRLSNGDVDTLTISYNTFETECCGITDNISNFRFNNSVDLPGDKGTQVIQK